MAYGFAIFPWKQVFSGHICFLKIDVELYIGHRLAYYLSSSAFSFFSTKYDSLKTSLEALTHLLTLGMMDPFAYAGGNVARECSIIRAALVK